MARLRLPSREGPAFRYSQITFTCVHEGKGCPRGYNVRPAQRYLGKNCTMKIELTLYEKRRPHYEVREFIDKHLTREVGPQLCMWYNHIRLLFDCEKEQISDLLCCNVKSKDIKK